MSSSLKMDPEVKELLTQLEHVKTARTFERWKSSFLNKWEEFLEQVNIHAADGAYKEFAVQMGQFVKLINTVNDFVDKGELVVDKTVVKARNSLNEMSKLMTIVINEQDALIPQTNAFEKSRGYNKFHMGAVLIRDNFREYSRLVKCRDILQHMRSVSLEKIADKQILEEMDNYANKLQKFCDVMADLGLFEVMLKCIEFDVEDEGPNLENLIFIDIKTQCFGELSREDCVFQKILTPSGCGASGHEMFAEAPTEDEAKEKLITIIKEHPTLGFGSGKVNNTYDRDEVGITEMEKVQNMWGVKLRKTPKNAKGEELIFVDQKSGSFGELSRKACLEHGLISEAKDETTGKFVLAEAFLDFEDRADIMERIRVLLKLGIEKP